MSRNLYKSYWVAISDEDKIIIDSNSRLEQRIEELETLRQHRLNTPLGFALPEEEEGEGEPEFVGGLGGEQIDALLTDVGDGAEGGVIKAAAVEQGPSLEEIEAQAQAMIEDAQAQLADAQAQVAEMMANAREDIEQERQQAIAEARKLGYDDGYQAGHAEADEMKRELEAERQRLYEEFDSMVEKLEPQFIDTITEIYSHIFGVELSENRDILVHLIDSTLRQVESSKTFIVHVSKDDYPFVNMHKQELVEGATAGKGLVEIIEDIALSQGACLIETDGGIFDCGVDTQLQALTNRLRVLSFEKTGY